MNQGRMGESWLRSAALACVAIGALALPKAASGALAIDSSSSGSVGPAGTTLTWNHVTASATTSDHNGLVIVGVSIANHNTISGVTFGGLAMSSLGSQNDAGTSCRVEMWYLLAPPVSFSSNSTATTIPVNVTLSSGTSSMVGGAVYFTGAKQSAPVGFTSAGSVVAGNTATSPSITPLTGEFLVDTVATVGHGGAGNSITAAAGQTSQWNISSGNAANTAVGGGSTKAGTGAATTTSWALNGTAEPWAIGVVRVQPSASTTLTATRINVDDLYGVDANNPAPTGPNLSPIGIRITNNTGTDLSDIGIALALRSVVSACGAGGTSPCVTVPGPTSYSNVAIPNGSTFDFYFILHEDNFATGAAGNSPTKAANRGFNYTITVSSATAASGDPVVRSSALENVIGLGTLNTANNSSNFTGCVSASSSGLSITVHQNEEFTCTVTSTTSASNLGNLRVWQDWNGANFSVDNVSTNYAANAFQSPSADCASVAGCGQVSITQTIVVRALASSGSFTIHSFVLGSPGVSEQYAGGTAFETVTLSPTAVRLKSFEVTREGEDNVVTWRTGHEVSNLGFHVYRDGPGGEHVRVNPEVIAGSALLVAPKMALESGHSYRFVDRGAPAGSTYQLEDIDLNGSIGRAGPVGVRETLAVLSPGSASVASAGAGSDSPYISEISFSGKSKHIPAGFSASGRSKTAGPSATNSANQNRQFSLAGQAGMKFLVNEEGWYRVTHQDLVDAGWDPGSSPANLQLYVEGQPAPMLVSDSGGGNYSMEFYGTGLDTVATDTRVYWLAQNNTSATRLTGNGGGSGGASPADFPFTAKREDKFVYTPGLPNGDAESWFGSIIWPASFGLGPTDESMVLTNLNTANTASATLDIALQGGSLGVTHAVDVSVNGNYAGTLTFKDYQHYERALTVPVSWLVEGSNAIELSNDVDNDYPLVDFITLTYPHLFRADSDALELTSAGSRQVSIAGFASSSVRVFDITNPFAVTAVPVTVGPDGGGGFSAAFTTASSVGTLRLLAVANDRVAAPSALVANVESTLNKKNNSADFVILTYAPFSSAAGALKALRQPQGLATQVVDVTDAYDEFNFGEKDPQALKSFLQWTKANWKKAPKYVLLLGDGSLDPRGYLAPYGVPDSDFVPARLVWTTFQKTASDDWFVDFNNDSIPEMAIARIPADSLVDAAAVVSKIVSYDSVSPASGVLIAGDTEDENDFEGASDSLSGLVSGKTTRVVKVGAGGAAARAAILGAFNIGVSPQLNGSSLINWVGHGEPTSWSQSDVFGSGDVPGLTNTVYPFVVSMDCLNGYFHDPTTQSLAEALLLAANGGAVAVWTSSTLTQFAGQVPANQALFQSLFGATPPRLGDATLAAKAATTDPDVRRTWILFGDPTMKFK